MIDLHNHTIFGDGKNTPKEMCKKAHESGVLIYGLSEHFPRPAGYDYPLESFNHDGLASRFFDYVSQAQAEKAAWSGKMTVLLGTEIDYLPAEEERIRQQLSAFQAANKQLEKAMGDGALNRQIGRGNRCEYCGTKVEGRKARCVSCGAPVKV